MGELRNDVKGAQEDLAAFLDERWKGMRPVACGDTLREAQLTAFIYEGLCGLDKAVNMQGKEDVQ
jgi:glycerol-3-phosphate dehydrogenase